MVRTAFHCVIFIVIANLDVLKGQKLPFFWRLSVVHTAGVVIQMDVRKLLAVAFSLDPP